MQISVSARRTAVKPEEFRRRLGRALESAMRSGETVAANEVPVDTGRLKNAIQIVSVSRFHKILVANTNYAKYVEFGTQPHTIRAKNADALFWKGADHPVRTVRHPGTPAQPFMSPARARIAEVLPRKIELALQGKI